MPACCVSFQLSLMKSVFPLPLNSCSLGSARTCEDPVHGSSRFRTLFSLLLFALGRDQAPVRRQAWTKGAAGKSVVIEVPDGRSLHRGAVERIIGLAVPVEVGRSDQSIAACNGRPECASDKRGAGQIPDCRLTGAGIEKQIIGFVIAIEVRHTDHSPVSWQSWSEDTADKSIVIEVPNRCLVCNSIEEHIIGLTVRVEIAHCYKVPTVRKTRAEGAANKGVV